MELLRSTETETERDLSESLYRVRREEEIINAFRFSSLLSLVGFLSQFPSFSSSLPPLCSDSFHFPPLRAVILTHQEGSGISPRFLFSGILPLFMLCPSGLGCNLCIRERGEATPAPFFSFPFSQGFSSPLSSLDPFCLLPLSTSLFGTGRGDVKVKTLIETNASQAIFIYFSHLLDVESIVLRDVQMSARIVPLPVHGGVRMCRRNSWHPGDGDIPSQATR